LGLREWIVRDYYKYSSPCAPSGAVKRQTDRIDMKRGVIIAPALSIEGDALVLPPGLCIDPAALRHYLLYWDIIEYPTALLSLGTSQDEKYLMDVGLLQRTKMPLDNMLGQSGSSVGGMLGKSVLYAQFEAAQKLNEKDPGQWTVAQNGPQLILEPELTNEVSSLEIELYDVLPTPGPLVPFEDILQFKEKRHDELIAFRSYMDELYQCVLGAGDIPRAKSTEIERLEQAINNLNNTASQSWDIIASPSFKAEFSLSTLAAGLSGMQFGTSIGFPLSSAVLGALAGSIRIEMGSSAQVSGTPNDFAYLCSVKRELQQ
jgi:hypothetical protein